MKTPGADLQMLSRKFSLPLLILIGIVTLLFGLWPLNFFPENKVSWLTGQDGIQFCKEGLSTRRASGGVVYSEAPLNVRAGPDKFESSTIEIHLESQGGKDGGLAHVLSFHDGYPLSSLVIGLWKSYLVIRSRDNRNDARDTYHEIDLKNGLGENEKRLITIASGPERTEIYVNGELARSYEVRSLIGVEHFCGYLNLGNSSIGHSAWVGSMYGVALYDKLLTPEQIRQNYVLWTNRPADMPAVIEPEPLILYTFAERTGASVHNQMSDANHLKIPSAFKALRNAMVVHFWREMAWNKGFVVDVVINIIGFFPFALCMLTFVTGNRRVSPMRAAILTVLASATLSLIIETTQMGLPTRTPSSLDFLCNTAGAALAILAFRIVARVKPTLRLS